MSTFEEFFRQAREYGEVKNQVEEHQRRLEAINGQLDEIQDKLNNILVKVGIAAGLGGAIAAPVIGAVIWIVSQ